MAPKKKGSKKKRGCPPQTPAEPGPFTTVGPYEKLINRMYEPLILLHALDPVRGEHIATTSPPINTAQHLRRQFRDDLAFLCEYDKGGDACTALGIEEREDCLVYWVAANTNPQNKIEPFLASLLGSLAKVAREGGSGTDASAGTARLHTATEEVTAKCATYALPKIKKTCALLRGRISDCKKCLNRGNFSEDDKRLGAWLQQFELSASDLSADGGGLSLCRLAHSKRKSTEMKHLKQLASEHDGVGVSRQCFSQAHHNIGRLAHHIRVPTRLVGCASEVEDLLLNPFSVQAIRVATCAPCKLLSSAHSKGRGLLEGIAIRMCNKDDEALLAELTTGLQYFDQKRNLESIVRQKYAELTESAAKAPRVHAEVQILEHFHANKLDWADGGDRYIGCSKPACFCCHLYFRHHPLRPVVPDCHNKVYLKWGPPVLAGGKSDPGYIEHRDVLNRFISDVRKDAIDQIREKRGRKIKW